MTSISKFVLLRGRVRIEAHFRCRYFHVDGFQASSSELWLREGDFRVRRLAGVPCLEASSDRTALRWEARRLEHAHPPEPTSMSTSWKA